MTYKDIKHNEEVNELLKKGNRNLGLLGYTDHSQAHCVRVAETAAHILKEFGFRNMTSNSLGSQAICTTSEMPSTGTATPNTVGCWPTRFSNNMT